MLQNLVRPPAGCQYSKKGCQCSKNGCQPSSSLYNSNCSKPNGSASPFGEAQSVKQIAKRSRVFAIVPGSRFCRSPCRNPSPPVGEANKLVGIARGAFIAGSNSSALITASAPLSIEELFKQFIQTLTKGLFQDCRCYRTLPRFICSLVPLWVGQFPLVSA